MMYLAYSEWENLGFGELSEAEFNRLLPLAVSIFEVETRNFYLWVDFDKDHEFRKRRVKLAIASFIWFMFQTGITSLTQAEESGAINSVSIGRTSVSRGNSSPATEGSGGGTQFPPSDFFLYLSGTGLLYRGTHYVR